MKGEDKERIESLTKTLGDVSGKMAERLYAQSPAMPGRPTRAKLRRAIRAAEPTTTWSMPSSKRSKTTRSKVSWLAAGFLSSR